MRFIVKRLALFVVALFGLSLLVFVLLRMLPGDVAAVIAGTNATPERIASLRAELGLDKSYVAQYGDWMLGLLHGRSWCFRHWRQVGVGAGSVSRFGNVSADHREFADRIGDWPAAWLRCCADP